MGFMLKYELSNLIVSSPSTSETYGFFALFLYVDCFTLGLFSSVSETSSDPLKSRFPSVRATDASLLLSRNPAFYIYNIYIIHIKYAISVI